MTAMLRSGRQSLSALGQSRKRFLGIFERSINYGHNLHHDMMTGTEKICITEYDEGGYVIQNINMRGAVAVFSDIAMLWKPLSFEQITKESLALFTLTEPAVEILLLGCGSRIHHDLHPDIRHFLTTNGIVVELLDSANACATFNILNAEDRRVAAAILPCDPHHGPHTAPQKSL